MDNDPKKSRAGENDVTRNIYCGLHELTDMTFLLHVLIEYDMFVVIGEKKKCMVSQSKYITIAYARTTV